MIFFIVLNELFFFLFDQVLVICQIFMFVYGEPLINSPLYSFLKLGLTPFNGFALSKQPFQVFFNIFIFLVVDFILNVYSPI